jgi:hypothetical protein
MIAASICLRSARWHGPHGRAIYASAAGGAGYCASLAPRIALLNACANIDVTAFATAADSMPRTLIVAVAEIVVAGCRFIVPFQSKRAAGITPWLPLHSLYHLLTSAFAKC